MTPCRDSVVLSRDQLTQLLQRAEQLVADLRHIRDQPNANITPPHIDPQPPGHREADCLTCSQRDTCTAPCEKISASLPSLDAGRRQSANVPVQILDRNRRPRSWHEERYQAFMAIRDQLKPAQFDVVSLVYGEAITQAEAARRLKRAPSTISEHMKKAEDKLLEARRQAMVSEGTADLALLSEQLGLDLSALDSDRPDSS